MTAQTTTTHALRYYGAAFDAEGNLINEDTKVTTGEGHAACTCGWLSEVQPNGARRRVAHKLHKLHIDEAAEAPEQTELVLGQDVIEGTPEDEVADALAELGSGDNDAFDQFADALGEVQPEDDEDDVPATLTDAVVFPTTVAKHFYRSLGRQGAQVIIDRHFTAVTPKYNAKVREVELSGPGEAACDAAEAILDMWGQAIAAFGQWLKTDPEYLALDKDGLEGRNATYHMKEAFFVKYATAYADAMDAS